MPEDSGAGTEVSRRTFLKGAGAAGVASQLTPALAASSAAQPFHPNVVYIHSHDSGRYLQPYGYNIPTPALQRLANEGTLFRNAFSVAPTCSPSRSGLLTGLYPHNNGMLGLAHRGFALNDYKQHIIHTLKAAGYISVLAGVQHVAKAPETIGYDIIVPRSQTQANHLGTTASVAAPAAAEFLDSRPKQPFFLDVGFFETHREYPEATADDPANYTAPPRPIPDAPATRKDFARYRASARLLDKGVATVLDALDRNGLSENTLIISTTDHGISFPRMKCNLTDDGWGVSLILRGPRIGKGAVQDALISHLDVFPTLCEYLGIQPPAWLQGKSFLPVLAGNVSEIHEEIFAEVNYHAAYEPQRAVRTSRWKYIRRFGDKTTPVLPNCDDGLSKSLWLEAGWATQTVEQESLYDLLFDPTEHRNLATDPTYGATLQDMRARLQRWMAATQDPLLKGPVAAPSGAVVNDPNGISPSEPVRLASSFAGRSLK
ncbi:Tat (twin-arginine translocation) pathway signal sequence [Granulicella rosea]|uniref:Tat (Twin-arginine translocation) pathway signal sequence n=1 Tax=Granulicella rosea TaxID=474952 RepID=A0A239K5A2_9BACT|nr:sulfatase-like hydrolase/transferase [Granulicella rosea]SNT13120.1 Tat (twin-arginine translocation) pathway signal sequence [Granulicella rosea]